MHCIFIFYRASVCLSVRPSHAGIVCRSKRLHIYFFTIG